MTEDKEQPIEFEGIYCANCRYCVLFRKSSGLEGKEYLLRIKCTQEQARRTVEKCDSYKDMGDLGDFLRILRKSLPVRDEVYSYKK